MAESRSQLTGRLQWDGMDWWWDGERVCRPIPPGEISDAIAAVIKAESLDVRHYSHNRAWPILPARKGWKKY